MTALITYLKHVRAEFAHIVWPNPRTAAWHTMIVIVVSAAVGGFISLLDYGLTNAVTRIIGG